MKQLLIMVSAALFATMSFSNEAVAAIQCYQCHGTSTPVDYRPLDDSHRNYSTGGFKGNHRTHMGNGATPASCNACHGNGVDVSTYLSNHRNDHIEMVTNINNSPKLGGASYSKGVFFNQTSVSAGGTCSNVNCHFESTTPSWGSTAFTSPNDCNQCHGAPPSGGSTGAAGSHAKHDLYYSGVTNCQKCHSNNTTFIHATSAGKRSLNISFSAAPNNGSGAYSGPLNDYLPSQTNVFGNCTNLYCHSNGKKALGNFSTNSVATWGNSLDCKGCHKFNNASADIMASGSHSRHVNATKHYTISCVKCHAATVNGSTSISDTTAHVNGKVNIKFSNSSSATNGTYGGQATPYAKDPGTAYGQCNNVYCHSNAQNNGGTGITYTQPTWGNAGSGSCGTCHGTSHSGGSEIASGSHTKHLAIPAYSGMARCIICHNVGGLAFDGSCNNSCHNATSKHTNNQIDLMFPSNFGVSATYNGTAKPGDGYSTCSNISCHYNTTTPTWGTGTPINCFGCHTLATLGGSHSKHINITLVPTMYNYTANRSTADDYNFGCSNCHPVSAANHMNGSINITLKKNEAGAGKLRTLNSATGSGIGGAGSGITGTSKSNVVCAAAYCHSNGNAAALVYAVTPDWYGGTFTGDRCANCHGNSPNSTIAGSKSHYNNRMLGYTSNPGGHVVGIHALSIYSSPKGIAKAGTTGKSSHGNPATSTAISCNICHYETVNVARNDDNVHCRNCHFVGNTVGAQTGNKASISDKSKHVNGLVNVSFKPVKVLSKAQSRQKYFVTHAYSSVWTRPAGYKLSGSHDLAKAALDTATMWDSVNKTCSNVACHMGNSVKWSDNGGITECVSCHGSL